MAEETKSEKSFAELFMKPRVALAGTQVPCDLPSQAVKIELEIVKDW